MVEWVRQGEECRSPSGSALGCLYALLLVSEKNTRAAWGRALPLKGVSNVVTNTTIHPFICTFTYPSIHLPTHPLILLPIHLSTSLRQRAGSQKNQQLR